MDFEIYRNDDCSILSKMIVKSKKEGTKKKKKKRGEKKRKSKRRKKRKWKMEE